MRGASAGSIGALSMRRGTTVMRARLSAADRSDWQVGWPVLLGAFVGVGTTWIFFQLAAGLFIVPMQAELGWSRTELSIGSWAGLGSGLLLPLTGIILDRVGARRMAIIGMMALTIGFVGLAALPANRIVLWAAIFYLSVAGSVANSVVFARGLATWFDRDFGTATGIMMSGPSVAAAIGIPMISTTIAGHGWRAGFLMLAAWVGLFGLPLVTLLFRERREPAILGPAAADFHRMASVAETMRSRNFWLLALATAVAALPVGGFLSHLQPILGELNVHRAVAARYGSLFAVSIGGGRLILGPLLDRLNAPFVTAGSLVVAAIGALLFSVHAAPIVAWQIALAIAFVGLAQGAEADYLKFFTARLFGLALFGRLAAIMSMIASAGMGLGGFLFAAIYDHHGSYALTFPLAMVLYLSGGILFALMRMPDR